MSYELKTLKSVCRKYINTEMTYRDIYDSYLSNTHVTGLYDRTTGLLDKWLWKYGNCTPSEFISLTNL